MSQSLQMIGNASLLDLPDKVAFLSSRRISPADVLKCYEWAEKVRDTGQCVVSGFQSPLVANGEPVPCGPGSQVEENLDLLISPEEQERLADVNFAAYNDGPVSQMVDRGQRVDKYRDSKFVIPQEYRIQMDVGPTFVADLR